jgi:hypothetical protein
MRNRPRLPVLLVIASIGLMAGATSLASARYVRPVTVQDGRYGVVRGEEVVGFKVRSRVVEDLLFSIHMECHNSDTNENYVRAFSSRDIGGGRVPFDGRWRKSYEDEDGFRQGSGVAEVEFFRSGRVLASVSVIVPGGGGSFETCHGFFANRVARGPLVVPSL